VPLFLVKYNYTDDVEAQQVQSEVRPTHRAWLAEQPNLIGSGPTSDNGAALVFEAAAAPDIATQLDQDPFAEGGFIRERTIVEWTVVLGRWAEKP
jgi:uncharacterized protein YciI